MMKPLPDLRSNEDVIMRKLLIFGLVFVLAVSVCGSVFAADGAQGFTLLPLTWNGAGLGKIALPNGYEFAMDVHLSDDTTCLGSPLRVNVLAASEKDNAVLSFYASENFIERVRSASPIVQHVDGQLDMQTMIFMMRYMNADQYCDARASLVGAPLTFYRSEDMSFFNSKLEQHRKKFSDLILPGLSQFGLHADWLEVTAAQRVYTYEAEGVTMALCILAEVRGYQYTIAGINDVCILWDVPAYYGMICPLSDYQRLHDTVFMPFVENTAVSDTFIDLQDQLTSQIRDITIQTWTMQVSASNAYAAAMNALTSASVNSYLQSSSYSNTDRFTDYIFDQNSYTTSDGYEVKISTEYDYVWDGGNGTVYYSDSAFDMPYGAVQLYPNR